MWIVHMFVRKCASLHPFFSMLNRWEFDVLSCTPSSAPIHHCDERCNGAIGAAFSGNLRHSLWKRNLYSESAPSAPTDRKFSNRKKKTFFELFWKIEHFLVKFSKKIYFDFLHVFIEKLWEFVAKILENDSSIDIKRVLARDGVCAKRPRT